MGVEGLIILAIGVVLVVWFIRKEGYTPERKAGPEPKKDFRIHNYLKRPITVRALLPGSTDQKILAENLGTGKIVGVSKEDVIKYLAPNSLIEVSIDSQPYSSTLVTTEVSERIKGLHIGMITSRFIGRSTDSLRMSTVADNALQGNAWLQIHNLTDIPLRLNDDIQVAPHSIYRYLGYRNQGVTLGMYFKDPDGLYPDYQYLVPNSDLYYGLTSDLKQPLQGPFQLEFNDDCDEAQTLWPFELGQM